MEFQKGEKNIEPIDSWFMKEVYLWRKAGSVFWFLICLPVLTIIYIFCGNLVIYHPLNSLIDFVKTVLSLSFCLSIILMLIINGSLIIYSSSLFTVKPEISSTRLANIIRLVRVSRLSHITAYSTSGLVISWFCSSFIGDRYSKLTQSPDGHVIQINEHHLFLVLYGLYLGLTYYCQFDWNANNYLQFPMIQREKFFQVRSTAGSLFLFIVKQTLKQLRYYYLIYYFFGGTIRSWIVFNLNLQYSATDVPLDSLFGIFHFSLLWQVFILGVYVNFSWSLAHLLFQVYQTEHYEFPVEVVTAFDNNRQKCLHDALSCNLQPIIKYLGYQDLCYLSRYSLERRKQVFCLSQPGGHPHAWNRLTSACLAEINDLNGQIETANWKAYTNIPVKPSAIIDKSSYGESINSNSMLYSINNNHSNNGQTLANQTYIINNTTEPTGSTETTEIPNKSSLTIWKERISALVSKKPIIGYFMGELPDAKSSQLFASSQVQIWAVEALSYMISASYTEDCYGIVQRSLPTILSTLVTLQENVDKHFKLVAPTPKRNQKHSSQNTHSTSMLRQELQAVLKTSIHRIINKFGKHVSDLPMDADCMKRLRPFIEYKE